MTFSIPKLAAIGTIALMTPAPALAEWMPVTVMDNNTEIYIESDSVVHDGQYVSFWKRYLRAVPSADGAVANDIHQLMDCRTGNWLEQQVLGFNPQGQVLYNIKPDSKQAEVFPTKPGSAGSDIYQLVCYPESYAQNYLDMINDLNRINVQGYWEDRKSSREFINNMFNSRY